MKRCMPCEKGHVVVDDERHALADKWYYHEHEVELRDAEWRYEFRLEGEMERSVGLVGNLEGWFERLWGV